MDFEYEQERFPEARRPELQQWAQAASRSTARLLERFPCIPAGSDREELLDELQQLQERVSPLLEEETDPEVRGRLRQHHEYAGRVISLVAGTTLTIQAPSYAIPGKVARVRLLCRNGLQRVIEQVQCGLNLPDGWKAKRVGTLTESRIEPNETAAAVYEVTVPSDAAIDVPVTWRATLTYAGSDSGRPLTVTQTHGMSVAKEPPAEGVPEWVDPEERLRLHADPQN
jgi:hypothetical protein